MAKDAFSSASQSGTRIPDLHGALLLVTPEEVVKDITTDFGIADATQCNIVVLDKPTVDPRRKESLGEAPDWEGEEFPLELEAVLIFQKALQGQLKSKVGKGMVLGRLGKRPPKKPGQDPAWILSEPTDEDKEVARAYLAAVDPFEDGE